MLFSAPPSFPPLPPSVPARESALTRNPGPGPGVGSQGLRFRGRPSKRAHVPAGAPAQIRGSTIGLFVSMQWVVSMQWIWSCIRACRLRAGGLRRGPLRPRSASIFPKPAGFGTRRFPETCWFRDQHFPMQLTLRLLHESNRSDTERGRLQTKGTPKPNQGGPRRGFRTRRERPAAAAAPGPKRGTGARVSDPLARPPLPPSSRIRVGNTVTIQQGGST